MPALTHRRFTRLPSTLSVNPMAGDQSVYHSLWEFEQIFEALPNGIATLDRKLRFLRINPAFAEWLALAPADLIGRSLGDVVPLWAPTLAPIMQQVMQNAAPACSVILSGGEKPVEWKLTHFPLRDKKNRVQGLLLRVDKTRVDEDKRAQAAEERYRLGLAHMQRVSTIAELASSLAHELNQPLTAILSNAQAALRFFAQGVASLPDIQEILKDIVADDKRAGDVISRLRVLLRKSDLEHRALSVNELIEDVYRILHSDAVARRSVIQLELAAELPFISGDPVQLQQVLLNLMLNGLQAMSEESPARRILVVSTRRQSAHQVLISVRDVGHGLDKENPQHVFEPFYTTKPDGLGMGLAIARSIIQSHEGQLWAEANPDRGATFHIRLPVRGME